MQNKKSLLILGGGIDQIPGILKAKEMGLYTIVLDGNANAKGQHYADEFYIVSIKHIQQIKYFVANQLTKKVDGVIAFGVDIPSIIAQTAQLLNINYTIPIQSAMLSENKFLSKEFMQQYSIASPPYSIVKNISQIKTFIEQYDFPIIIKPIDNSASRGISFVKDEKQLQYYFNYALEFSNAKKVQVEKYLSGAQVSTETFIINGEVYNIGFLDRNYNNVERFFPNIIENGGDMPSTVMKEKHKQQLTYYLQIIAKQLDIKNGIIKGDIIIHNDDLYIIEFALRLSGGNFSTICIPASTGVDFIKISIQLHLNYSIDIKKLMIKLNNNISMRYKFTEDLDKTDKIQNIILPKQEENILFSNFHVNVEDTISEKTTNHAERLGFAIATGNTREDAIKNAQKYLDNVEIICE